MVWLSSLSSLADIYFYDLKTSGDRGVCAKGFEVLFKSKLFCNNFVITMQIPNLQTGDRLEIFAYFDNAWQIEESLMQSLVNPKTFYVNPDPLRNLLIFYLGHSAVFYINKLILVNLLDQRLNSDLEILFEMGVDPERPDEIIGIFDRLRQIEVADVWAYRRQVYTTISDLIHGLKNIQLPINQDHPLWALMMAIEHQYIHIETSSMLIRQLPVDQLQKPKHWQYAPANIYTTENEMIEIKGGQVQLGKPQNSSTYGWDIEYGDRKVEVQTFQASKYLVTNGEYLNFVKDGGYQNQDYWREDSWAWKTANQVQHPKFWIHQNNQYQNNQYQYRAMFDETALPFDFPVEVNYYEAIAYCRWQGDRVRLMSEAEWHLATYAGSTEKSHEKSDLDFNLNLKFASPSAVGYSDGSKSASGLSDLRGNVWEWLSDHLTPLPSYKPHPLYQNYSAPYFDTKHQMMAGGSWITCGTEAGKYYRNWFRPNFYQHAGFRTIIS
jgi:5-histidylcysteine sulfoxide synthase